MIIKTWAIKGEGFARQTISQIDTGEFQFCASMWAGEDFICTILSIDEITANRKIKEWNDNPALTVIEE